jgi:hypothetical protein
MSDYTIRARFEAQAAPADVKRWLDNAEGIAGWWSDKVIGSAGTVGDSFEVSFPSTPVAFGLDVMRMDDDTIEWHVPENPAWWKGSTIGFHLDAADGGGTSMLFAHAGFSEGDPIIEIITPAWIRYLDNLIAVAESGTPNPAVTND